MDTSNYTIQLTLPVFDHLFPPQPLIERLYDWISAQSRQSGWGAFRNSIRAAADDLGCSPSIISRHLQTLESTGRIIIERVSKFFYLRLSQMIDHQPSGDRSPHAYKVLRILDQEEEEGRSRVFENNQPAEPSPTPQAPSPTPEEPSDPRAAELEQNGVMPQVIPEILENQPGSWNIGDFLRDVTVAAKRNKGIGYVINTWRNGRRLSSGGAQSDGDTGRSTGTSRDVVEADRTTRPGAWRDDSDSGPTCPRPYAEYLGTTGTGRQRVEQYRMPDGSISNVRVGQGGTLAEVWTPINTTFDTSDWA